jgi:glycosyltransferase involved in cell wall biosynthesis
VGPIVNSGRLTVEVVSAGAFPERGEIEALRERGGDGAVLLLQRVLASPADVSRLRAAYEHILFDIDDAIYAVPPNLERSRLRQLPKTALRLAFRGSPNASRRKKPLARLLRAVDVCVVGNSILGEFASRYVRRFEEIPTTVEPVNRPPPSRPRVPVLVWMGLADNLQYLGLLKEALTRLARQFDFRLRIVSSRPWSESPIPSEFVAWSPEAARDALLTSTVGLAPLTDDPWTRGKCAFRSIQYGGHALPTVASPVGITDRVIQHGETGYLARSAVDWIDFVGGLLENPTLVDEIGSAALRRIRRLYSNDLAARRWTELLASL